MPSPALLDSVVAALPDGAPGLQLRALVARVEGWGYEAVRAAMRVLIEQGRAQATGNRSHRLYRRGAPDLDPDARDAAAPAADAAATPPGVDVAPALAFLERRGFRQSGDPPGMRRGALPDRHPHGGGQPGAGPREFVPERLTGRRARRRPPAPTLTPDDDPDAPDDGVPAAAAGDSPEVTMLAYLKARWDEATSIWAKAGLTALALAWATGQMTSAQALAAAAGAVVLYLHPEAEPALGAVAAALAQAARGQAAKSALAGLALLAGLGLAGCANAPAPSVSATVPGTPVPGTPVPGTTVPAPAPTATAAEITAAWSAAQAGYAAWGGIVTTLIEAEDPSASGALTQANATLKAFFAQPVPTDPTRLSQDWPAIDAALLTLAPLIEKAIAAAVK